MADAQTENAETNDEKNDGQNNDDNDGVVLYVNSEPVLSDLDINEEKNCPIMYKQSWSKTLNDIVTNFLRSIGILKSFEDVIIPKSVFDEIARFYCNDLTKYRSFEDYMHAILVCKYFSVLKKTRKPDNENDIAVKRNYKLTAKAALTTSKILKALADFKKNEFKIFNGEQCEELEIYFVDHTVNKVNLTQYSYPEGATYTVSADELALITAIRDAVSYIDAVKAAINWDPDLNEMPQHCELRKRVEQGYFKTSKTSIRYHTIIEYQRRALFALDYEFKYSYLLFVFRFFSIIIHEKMDENERHTTRRMNASVISARYRAILEQLEQSGL